MPALSDLTSWLDRTYDPRWAEGWDAVGLVSGDPDQPVRKVMFAVDPVPAVAREAVEWGADLLVVHHPLFLKPVSSVAATSPKGRTLQTLLRAGCALFTAHTNADVPPHGVNEALARAVGLSRPRIIEPLPADGLDKLVTFAPHEYAEELRAAVTAAGAGAIGDYDSCTFTVEGEGRFRPLDGATPAIGRIGEVEVVAESRIEAVYPRSRRQDVVTAMKQVHPYEEPAYDILELAELPGAATRGHGRIGELAAPTSLRAFAEQVRQALPDTAHGVRVAGDPDRPVRTVAVACGAGDYLLDRVLRTDADVYLTSDLRHHRAAEFLEHDGPALVDVAHWAAEWTWLPVVEQALLSALGERGDTVETRVSTVNTDPWQFRV
ncbi:MAG TPA: Nif3-like dinuclear metal center hexameric protein [Nocardioidaceae bacterium]|nr:Nif3-like dinuclear metal center hexameric protein [Nocardioidaceae bacterium]